MIDGSAAVIPRADGSFLIARRPAGKVYAGYWELPGGKIELGEPAAAALTRELHEELGIDVIRAYPWITRVHAYPHATVRLNFFRVLEWSGEPHPREAQTILWQPSDAPVAQPMLPANAPVLASLALGAGPLVAQTVPDSSQAAKVQAAYRRTPTFRVDPFRQAMIPHWGFVIGMGALGENNTLNMGDVGALYYLHCQKGLRSALTGFLSNACPGPDSLSVSDMLNTLGLIPDGKGLRGSGLGEGGVSLGGPCGSRVNLALSGQCRA